MLEDKKWETLSDDKILSRDEAAGKREGED